MTVLEIFAMTVPLLIGMIMMSAAFIMGIAFATGVDAYKNRATLS